MKFSKEQLNRLNYIIEDEYVVEDDEQETNKNFKNAVKNLKSPEELHYFATNFNWDCGTEDLEFLLTHPLIDKATILMIYWMAGPGYYMQYENKKDLSNYEKEQFEFILKVHHLLKRVIGKESKIEFNPADHNGVNWTTRYKPEMIRLCEKKKVSFYNIPSEFFKKI